MLSFIVDELTSLVSPDPACQGIMADDLTEFCDRIMRSHRVAFVCAHQEVKQFSPAVQQVLDRLATQIIGQTSDLATARHFADRYYPYNPYAEKLREPVFADRTHIVWERPVFFTPEEQTLLHARPFMQLQRHHWLVSISPREGELGTRLLPMTTKPFAQNFPDIEFIAALRHWLTERDGYPVSQLLTHITGAEPPLPRAGTPGTAVPQGPTQEQPHPGSMKPTAAAMPASSTVPIQPDPAAHVPLQTPTVRRRGKL